MGFNVDELLLNIFRTVHSDQNILKYLYYPAEDGDFDILAQPDLDNAQRDQVVKKISVDVELLEFLESTVKRGRIGIYLQSTNPTNNTYVPDRRIRIEIYMPIRKFQEFDYRIAYIVERLDTLLLQENVDGGLGRLNIESSNYIGAKIDGYEVYYHDYSSGSLKGRGC